MHAGIQMSSKASKLKLTLQLDKSVADEDANAPLQQQLPALLDLLVPEPSASLLSALLLRPLVTRVEGASHRACR